MAIFNSYDSLPEGKLNVVSEHPLVDRNCFLMSTADFATALSCWSFK